jgi:hypothetical protein
MNVTPPPVIPRQRSWFERNWKWFVPTLVMVAVGVLALFIGGICMVVLGMIKASHPYQEALRKVQTDSQAIELLGEPIQPKWWVMGNIQLNNSSGHADLTIPVSGPKQNGTIFLEANRRAGEWKFKYLILEGKKDRTRLDLISKETPKN